MNTSHSPDSGHAQPRSRPRATSDTVFAGRNGGNEAFTFPRLPPVSEAPFAGRIGGNQEFTVFANDEKAQSILKKHPDAAPLQSLKDSLDLRGFLQIDLWRMAVIEGWGTCILIFTFGAGASGLTTLDLPSMAITLYAALLNVIGLTLFIFSAAPASGGHLNPSITMATFFAGLSTLPRTVLYIVAQSLGAIIGCYWLRLGLGDAYFPTGVIPGCTVDPTLVSRGELFVLEYMFAQALIFTAFGVGLDPRQGKVFGPALSPILVGLTLGLGTLASSLAKPGYTGISVSSVLYEACTRDADDWLKVQPSSMSWSHGRQRRNAISLHPLAWTSVSGHPERHFLLLRSALRAREAAARSNSYVTGLIQLVEANLQQ